MELGDFEPANEYEFDLSDVDVAAFESVATEDTNTNSTLHQQQQLQLQQQQQQQLEHHLQHLQQEQQLPPQSPHLNKSSSSPQHQQQQQHQPQQQQQSQQPPSPSQSKQQTQTQQQLHHVTQLNSTSSNPNAGKILLVPLNSKAGPQPFKHIIQLQGTTMGALTTPGNKKQILQLAQLTTSSFNSTSKNNYSFPVTTVATTTTTTTSQLLPGSSQSQKQQVYLTTSNASPMKQHQPLSLNSVLNKSLNNLQNNNSVTTQYSLANMNTSRNISYNDTMRASTPNSNGANEVPKRKPCNCTKSQCLKLYCDCFANGEFCSGCNCTNCFNSLSKEKERQKAITQCLERNPEAFRPKIGKAVKSSIGEPAPESIERRHTKGCNCKRSGCLKNYCECYEAKILCSNLCKCCGCKNYEESFERKSLMQLANSTSENARGILKNLLPTNNNSNTGKEFTKCFITDKVIHASLVCLLQSAQQAEKDGIQACNVPNLIQTEMGKCLRMIVDSATESSSPKKRWESKS